MANATAQLEAAQPNDSAERKHDAPSVKFNSPISSRSDLTAVQNMENASVKTPDSYGFPSGNNLLAANEAKPVQSETVAQQLEPPLVPQLDNSVPLEKPVPYQTINFDGFEIHRYPNVSDAFLKSAEEHLQQMPEKEKDLLRKSGMKVSVSNLLADADKEADKNPFDERGGEYITTRNEIVFSQREENTTRFKRGVKLGTMGNPSESVSTHTFYHEWGHALDYNLQPSSEKAAFSDTKPFITPYLRELFDTFKNHKHDFQDMHYFVSDNIGDRNRTEMFAEMYTIARGKGNPKDYSSDKMIPKDFKDTYAAAQKKLNETF